MLAPGAPRTGPREWFATRELLVLFVRRDLAVRYSQTFLGILWVLAQPIATAVLFSVVLGRFAGVPTDGVSAPVFYLAGLVPWSLVAGGIARGTSSLADHPRLVSGVYLPRIHLLLAAVLGPCLDAILGTAALVVVLVAGGIEPSIRWLVAIPAALWLASIAFGFVLVAAPLNARFRDVRHAVPFGIQLLLFASPVAYPLSVVPDRLRVLLGFHPVALAIEAFRWAFTGRGSLTPIPVACGLGLTFVLILVGLRAFLRAERTLADVV